MRKPENKFHLENNFLKESVGIQRQLLECFRTAVARIPLFYSRNEALDQIHYGLDVDGNFNDNDNDDDDDENEEYGNRR